MMLDSGIGRARRGGRRPSLQQEFAGLIRPLFERCRPVADVLVLCGDLTDYGLPEEAHLLVKEMAGAAKLPIVAVLGNHDFESGREEEVRQILVDAGFLLLDGDAVEVKGSGSPGPRDSPAASAGARSAPGAKSRVKAFVQEAIDEAMKLESALARLRTESRVAVLHYAPIRATVENEPVEIFPFLGCSRLEEPLNRYPVSAVVHGHAHNGSPEGRTATGVPVYNVSLPLMRHTHPDKPPFLVLEFPSAPVGQ